MTGFCRIDILGHPCFDTYRDLIEPSVDLSWTFCSSPALTGSIHSVVDSTTLMSAHLLGLTSEAQHVSTAAHCMNSTSVLSPPSGLIYSLSAATAESASTPALAADYVEPTSYRKIATNPHAKEWYESADAEHTSLIDQGTWVLVPYTPGMNVVKCKWVFKAKKGPSGELDKLKSRLVACGYSQKHGIDYDETFSPVVRHSTIQFMIAVGTALKLDMWHLDVKTAFLNPPLTETIYMEHNGAA